MLDKICIGALVLLASSTASADTLVVSATAAGTVGGTPVFDSPAVWTADLQQFDATLGTLNSVDITISAWHDGTFEFTTNGDLGGYRVNWVDYSFEVNGFGGSGGNLLFEDWVVTPSLPDIPFGDHPGHFNTGPDITFVSTGDTGMEAFGTYLDFADTYLAGDAEFSQFIGAGTLPFEIVDWATFGLSTIGSDISWGIESEAGLLVEATYNYTPVPAPSAIALLAVSGLFAGKRRR